MGEQRLRELEEIADPMEGELLDLLEAADKALGSGGGKHSSLKRQFRDRFDKEYLPLVREAMGIVYADKSEADQAINWGQRKLFMADLERRAAASGSDVARIFQLEREVEALIGIVLVLASERARPSKPDEG